MNSKLTLKKNWSGALSYMLTRSEFIHANVEQVMLTMFTKHDVQPVLMEL